MKKILILAYDFPPNRSIGAQRPYSWYKYFRKFDLYPVVITRHWDDTVQTKNENIKPTKNQNIELTEDENGTVIRVPFNPNVRDRLLLKYGKEKFSFFRKFLSAYYSISSLISFKSDNTSGFFLVADKYINENRADLIIATGEPFILFRYANILSRQHNIKWVADYRDSWTTEFFYHKYLGLLKKLFIKYYFRQVEKRIVANARFITVPSQTIKDDILKILPEKTIHIIYNGYESSVVNSLQDQNKQEKIFEIAYAGTLYNYQPVEEFLDGYKKFIKNNKNVNTRIVFYGLEFYPDQKKRIIEYDSYLKKYIITTERLPYKNVMEKMLSASILLLLSNENFHWLAAKIFDYFALNRKIILYRDDKSIMGEFLDTYKGGIKCSTVDEVANSLSGLYNEFLEHGEIKHQTINYKQFSREEQTRVLSGLLLKFQKSC